MISRRLEAPPERVLAAAAEPIPTAFADPIDPRIDGTRIVWSSEEDVVDEVERVAEITAEGDGAILTMRARSTLRMPYFSWVFLPFVRYSVRKSILHMADVIEARVTGGTVPEPRRPAWITRDRMTARQSASIATVCIVLLAAGFCGSLFTQTLDYVATSFDASDADLGVALAVTRVGVLVGLVGSALADRRGRRRILLVSLAGVSVASALTALAPNLYAMGALQVFVRGCVQLSGVVGYICVTEEAPEGSRAFLLAVAGMATGAGFALAAGMLPLAEIAEGAWRILFAAGGLGLLLLPGVARRLAESGRYAAMSQRAAAARASELVDPIYGGRFAVAAAISFLLGFFAAPSLQFTNRYLSDVRGYSAAGIVWLRSLTQGAPALLAIIAGGRLAESSGRKRVASRGTFALALATFAFFLLSGAGLWLAFLAGTIAGALSGPALTVFTTELFPTEVRGRAGAALLIASVIGAVAGLLLVGYLADPLGHIGKAIALTCVAPLIVALALIPRLPEGRGRNLDELSPPEV